MFHVLNSTGKLSKFFYSYLKESMGSNFDALLAGMMPESNATAAHNRIPIMIHSHGIIKALPI